MKVDLTKYIEEHIFSFDNSYDKEADNNQIYQECVLPLVSETFKGAKTTCFAYGQTGCGKSHTMMGIADKLDANGQDMKGIIPKSVNHIFGFLDNE